MCTNYSDKMCNTVRVRDIHFCKAALINMDFIVLLLYVMSLFICALLQAEFSSLRQKKNWAEHDYLYVWKASHTVINLQRVMTQLCRSARLYEVFQRLQCFGFLTQKPYLFKSFHCHHCCFQIRKMGVIHVLHLIWIVFSAYFFQNKKVFARIT